MFVPEMGDGRGWAMHEDGWASHLFNEDLSARLFATKSGSSRTSALIHTLPCHGQKWIVYSNLQRLQRDRTTKSYETLWGLLYPYCRMVISPIRVVIYPALCLQLAIPWGWDENVPQLHHARCPQWDFAGLEQISWLEPAGLELETEYDLVTYNLP